MVPSGADRGRALGDCSAGQFSMGNSSRTGHSKVATLRDVFNHATECKSLSSLFKFSLSPVFILAMN